MDSKTLRLSVAAIITTVVLIAVVVYAANRDRIDKLVGTSSSSQTEEEETQAGAEISVTGYGEQIGDNLKGFLTADDFFDKSEQRPSVVVVVDNVPVPANSSSQDGTTDLSDIPSKDSREASSAKDEETGGGPADKTDEETNKEIDKEIDKDDEKSDKAEESGALEKDEEEKPEDDTTPEKPEGDTTSKKPEGEAASVQTDEESASENN